MLASDVAQQLDVALRGLAYGSIQLIVHESRIVRIERVERIRLPAASDAAAQAGLTGSPEADPSTRTTACGRGLARDSAPRAAKKVPRALPVGLHSTTITLGRPTPTPEVRHAQTREE